MLELVWFSLILFFKRKKIRESAEMSGLEKINSEVCDINSSSLSRLQVYVEFNKILKLLIFLFDKHLMHHVTILAFEVPCFVLRHYDTLPQWYPRFLCCAAFTFIRKCSYPY